MIFKYFSISQLYLAFHHLKYSHQYLPQYYTRNIDYINSQKDLYEFQQHDDLHDVLNHTRFFHFLPSKFKKDTLHQPTQVIKYIHALPHY